MSLSFPPRAPAELASSAPSRLSAFMAELREVYLFGALLAFVALSLLLVSSVGMDTLSATRAYATGEGLWSKRQKEAASLLTRYASSRDERDYEAYRSALEVPLGDKQARLELEKEAPDLAVARAGFLKGKNHPDDVPKLISLFLRFRRFELMAKAIRIWTEGDVQIERLMALGEALHAEVATGPGRPLEVQRLVREIAAADLAVTPLEDAFSQQLGQAARWTQRAALWLLVCVGGVVMALCVPLSVGALRGVRASQRSLRENERRFRALLENSSDAIALFSREGTILYASAASTRILGYPLGEFVGRNAFEFVQPESRPEVAARLTEALERPGEMVRVSANVRHRDGGWRFLEGVFTNLLDDPAVGGIVNNYRDITERKRAEDALRTSEERYRSLFERNLAGVFRTSRDGTFLDCNEAFAQVLGYESREELLRRPVLEFYESASEHQAFLARLEREKVLVNLEARYVRRDGSTVWTLENVSLVEADGVTLIEGTLIDVSERKSAQQRVEYHAYHDALTGLPNRLLLRDRLTVALAHARRETEPLVVMFLDLDRFKLVNDSLGHSLGDALLKEVAERLVQSIREQDTIARVGGDEFILLFPGITRNEDAAARAQKILNAVALPFNLQGHEVYVTTSIGIAAFPSDGLDAETLLKSADSAMYRAKELGRNVYQHWTPGMNARALERMAVEGRLRRALEREAFLLHYQPIVDGESGRVVRVEALVRWQDPERGLVTAGSFVPMAEECGLMVPLGEWVLRTALFQLAAWHRAGLPHLEMAVNLSTLQLEQRGLPLLVEQMLAESGIAARCLELEITESVAAEDVERTTGVLRKLRALGARISLDDFGTGQSSLSYLRHFPVDGLKIDRSFVRDLRNGAGNEAIVRAVIGLAHGLGLKVVAEGVETAAQMAFLREEGCDEVQGYLVGRPVPASSLVELLESLSAAATTEPRRG